MFLNLIQLLRLVKEKMNNKYQLLGRCGIFCGTDCALYQAAHSSDIETKRRVARALEQELGIKIDPSSLRCEGCQGSEENMWFECRLCRIRQCGKRQGIKLCTECQDYPCQIMELWLSKSQSAPKNLPEISELGLDQWIEKKLEKVGCNVNV
jgi:hypothetical protein